MSPMMPTMMAMTIHFQAAIIHPTHYVAVVSLPMTPRDASQSSPDFETGIFFSIIRQKILSPVSLTTNGEAVLLVLNGSVIRTEEEIAAQVLMVNPLLASSSFSSSCYLIAITEGDR